MERKSREILFDPVQTDNVLHGGEENSTFLKSLNSGDLLEKVLSDEEDKHVIRSSQSELINIHYRDKDMHTDSGFDD